MALAKLAEEDPTFTVRTDEASGQTIISGMGELHLDILVDRMKREFNDFFLSYSSRFLKVTNSRFCGMFLVFVIETKLQRFVPVNTFGSDLGNNAWSCLNNGTRDVFPVLVEDAGHADFSTN
jgi:hypothetical protein